MKMNRDGLRQIGSGLIWVLILAALATFSRIVVTLIERRH